MAEPFRVLDLFSGIGGFTLGLERTGGFRTVAFCEIEPYPRKILRRHWPDVPIFPDVRALTGELLAANGIAVDVITGGFPCQDISDAGLRIGIEGERSSLWSEISRLAGEIRPRFVIVENVSGLLARGLGRVLGDLAALGYDAEWHCIPAIAVGADHIRDRIWIIAYPYEARNGKSKQGRWEQCPQEMGENAAYDRVTRLSQRQQTGTIGEDERAISPRLGSALNASPDFPGEYRMHEPLMGRGKNGIPYRVDRVRALGNAVVPQIPEMIGRAILEAIEATGPIMRDYRT